MLWVIYCIQRHPTREPVIQEADNGRGTCTCIPDLITDLHGRIVVAPDCIDTASLLNCGCCCTKSSQEGRKRRSRGYWSRAYNFHSLFASIYTVLGHEANFVMKYTWLQKYEELEKSLSGVQGWVWARMAFSVLKETNLCLTNSIIKWKLWSGMQVYCFLMSQMLWCVCVCAWKCVCMNGINYLLSLCQVHLLNVYYWLTIIFGGVFLNVTIVQQSPLWFFFQWNLWMIRKFSTF